MTERRSLRIAIAKPRKRPGGGTTMALAIAQGLRNRGHDVFLLAHPLSDLRPRARKLGFDVAPVLVGRDVRPLAWVWSWQALLRRRPDVLLAFVARENNIDFAVPPAPRLGIPIDARRRLTGVPLDAHRGRGFEQVQWVGVSRANAQDLQAGVPGAPEPETSLSGSDLERIRSLEPPALDLPEGELAVGSIARLHREKGIEERG